jgi:hypothetical protein
MGAGDGEVAKNVGYLLAEQSLYFLDNGLYLTTVVTLVIAVFDDGNGRIHSPLSMILFMNRDS